LIGTYDIASGIRSKNEEIIEAVAKRINPFTGSGTTLAAAFGLGRSGFGCEMSPAYTDVIVNRIQTLSSQSFHLDGDGRSFEEIKLDRICGSSKQSEVVAA
jgi:adenine specific DNA methylase Mod